MRYSKKNNILSLANNYEMKLAFAVAELRENFTDCFPIEEEHLLEGTLLSPQPAGEREHVVINQQVYTYTYIVIQKLVY